LKYWPSSRDFNKLVIKAKMHVKNIFLKFSLLYSNTIWFFFIFERLGRMHENKIFFLFMFIIYFLMSWQKPSILILDLYLYNIKIQTSIDQNALKKIAENHILKKIIFGEFNFFLGWAQPGPQWPGWATESTREFLHACINSAKVIKLPSHSN